MTPERNVTEILLANAIALAFVIALYCILAGHMPSPTLVISMMIGVGLSNLFTILRDRDGQGTE